MKNAKNLTETVFVVDFFIMLVTIVQIVAKFRKAQIAMTSSLQK